MSMVNLLAGDVGGTTTRLGLFEKTASRPRPIAVREFATLDFPDLRSMIAAFLEAAPRADLSNATACFGVAGPVAGDAAEPDERALAAHGGRRDRPRLRPVARPPAERSRSDGLRRAGARERRSPRAADRTPCGGRQHRGHRRGHRPRRSVPASRRTGAIVAVASEAGHADFAARTDREIALLKRPRRALRARPGGRRDLGAGPAGTSIAPSTPSHARRRSIPMPPARRRRSPRRPWPGAAPAASRR